MDAKHSLLEKIKDGSFALKTDEEIARLLHLGRRESLAARDMLHALCREGELLCDSRFRFGTAQQFGARRGTVSGHERGFAFFTPADGGDDLFLPHRALKGALHGDTVLVCAVRGRSDDEGEVLAILDHGIKELVGTYRRDGKAGVVVPDEKRYNAEIFIPNGKNLGCAGGMKAVVRLVSFPDGKSPVGEITEVLGKQGDFFSEELSLIRAHHLREEFPSAAEEEATRCERRGITDEDLRGRRDLRGELVITVDGEDTRDIDDAISIRERGGLYELGVHIADVGKYVPRGGELDREAFRRGTSVYFPDRVLPMLPRALSNGICSLNEGETRLTLSCLMTVNQSGKVISKQIAESVICSRHRMTYRQIAAIADGDEAAKTAFPDLIGLVSLAVELTKILQRARKRRGGVALDLKEAKILYADGKISIPETERTIAHEMIEQFMVLANESVATLMTEKKVPFVYRVHEPPSEEKARGFLSFLSESGVKADFDPARVTPRVYQSVLDSLEGSRLYPLVNRVMLRSMMKARYSPENTGHFGLASDCYCHFTSPIRRYPDLCIHRIIKETIAGGKNLKEKYAGFVATASEQSSDCERNAQEAERDVDALYTVAYMQDKIGEEYEATVSGVTAFGIFAELANTVEGFIPVETLPEDFYELLEERQTLKGLHHSFTMGEQIRVRVVGVDWGSRRTRFELLEKLP